MKNYIVTHTFKSKEAKAKMMEVVGSMSKEDMVKSMSGENAKCQMSWNTPGDNLTMFCWWTVSYTHLTLPTTPYV